MKEENSHPVSSVMAANLAAITSSGHRYFSYPFLGQTVPYIPWEWVTGVPSRPPIATHRFPTMDRFRGETRTQRTEEETQVDSKEKMVNSSSSNPSASCSSPKTVSQSSSVITFSIDDILRRKEPQRRATFVSLTNSYPLNTMVASELEDDSEGDGFKSGPPHDFMESSSRYSWLQCTRYRPPKLPRIKKKESGKKRKLGRNPRVPFTQHQVAALEQKFHHTHYLSSADVAELSTALNLTETRVKIWFQNRRARERRDREGASRSEIIGSKPITSTGTTTFPVPTILTWPSPMAPNPSTMTQFSNALTPGGKSAFKPVS